jgi:hypothetical protein
MAGFGIMLCLAGAILLMVGAPSPGTVSKSEKPGEVRFEIEPEAPRIVLEAESGKVVAPMQVFKDSSASGGEYVMTPEPPNVTNETKGGQTELSLDVKQAGKYNLWLRVNWDTSCDNSLWVRVDEKLVPEVTNNTYKVWQWMQVGRLPFDLKTGNATLVIGSREDGSKLDQVLLTQDLKYKYVPEGIESSH